jgi:hypothetical protein
VPDGNTMLWYCLVCHANEINWSRKSNQHDKMVYIQKNISSPSL